ncbi:unnamed protein product, partial [Vitis vinifera]
MWSTLINTIVHPWLPFTPTSYSFFNFLMPISMHTRITYLLYPHAYHHISLSKLIHPHSIKPPKGVLLYGPPGIGKTLLARAIASNIDANFLKVVSSAIIDKYIGERARLMREMFGYARDHQPYIIFMDEIDAIGKRRFSEGICQNDYGEVHQLKAVHMMKTKWSSIRWVEPRRTILFSVSVKNFGPTLHASCLQNAPKLGYLGHVSPSCFSILVSF